MKLNPGRSLGLRRVLGAAFALGMLNPLPAANLSADGWAVTSVIECGNAASIVPVGENHVAIAPREDPIPVEIQVTGPISSYVIGCEITNQSPAARTLAVDVVIPGWMIKGPKGRFDYFLRKPYLLRDPSKLAWTEVPAANQIDLPDRVRLTIGFAPRERKILSTIPFFPFSAVQPALEKIALESRGDAQVTSIGRSAEGRPIWGLEIGAKDRPTLAFTATLQPGEPSAWAILAMGRAAVSDPAMAKRREGFRLVFLPMTNPDGVHHGFANTNSGGKMVFLGFEAAAKGEATFHEAKVIWDYLAKSPPAALVEFHSLALPNHKVTGPYVIDPVLFTDSTRRAFSEVLAKGLTDLSGPAGVRRIRAGHPMWRQLLIYQAITNWNTAAFLYQNTGPSTSYRQSEDRGVEILKVTLQIAARGRIDGHGN